MLFGIRRFPGNQNADAEQQQDEQYARSRAGRNPARAGVFCQKDTCRDSRGKQRQTGHNGHIGTWVVKCHADGAQHSQTADADRECSHRCPDSPKQKAPQNP